VSEKGFNILFGVEISGLQILVIRILGLHLVRLVSEPLQLHEDSVDAGAYRPLPAFPGSLAHRLGRLPTASLGGIRDHAGNLGGLLDILSHLINSRLPYW